MEKVQWYWVVAASFLVGLLAWDNWQVREELDQLRKATTPQTAVVSRTPVSGNDCPAITLSPPTKLTLPVPPAVNCAESAPNQNTGTVQIPPGTDLLEAIKIIQREQAKSQPGSAGINPFGPSQ